MDPNALPFDADAMLDGLRTWIECESPTYDAAAVNRMMDIAVARTGDRRCADRARRRPHGLRRLRARHLPARHAERAGHPGDGPSRHRASDRHAGETAVPARRRARLGARHPGHEGRQLHGAGGDPPACRAPASRRKLPITVLLTSDEEVGSPSTRDLIEAEASRHRIRAGAGTGARRWRRGDRPLRDRALQPGSDRPAEPRRRAPGRGPLGDPRDGAQADRDRGHDHRGLHLLGRRDPRRTVGELRHHHLHRRGAVDGQAAGGPRPRRRRACWRCRRRRTTCSSR